MIRKNKNITNSTLALLNADGGGCCGACSLGAFLTGGPFCQLFPDLGSS